MCHPLRYRAWSNLTVAHGFQGFGQAHRLTKATTNPPPLAAVEARQKKRWMIRVTDRHGNDMYLRRGSRAGYGPIVRFGSKLDAEINVELIEPGLDQGTVVAVVPYDNACE